MSIPNPYPNIADKEINDLKTWSSAKIIDELQPALDTEITCEETYEGNIVTFNNLTNKEITSLECEILPIQEGTGTPSPSNPRPISGTSTLDIYHSGADTSDYDTTSVSLGQEIMGGSADVVGGVGSKTRRKIDLSDSSNNWTYTNGVFYSAPIYPATYLATYNRILCSIYKDVYVVTSGEMNNGEIRCYSNRLYVKDNRFSDVASFVEGVEGEEVCYELATPTDFTFTGQPINSYLGTNNVWTDSGDIKVTTSETETIGNILKERGILP